jgi:hypothetical protein
MTFVTETYYLVLPLQWNSRRCEIPYVTWMRKQEMNVEFCWEISGKICTWKNVKEMWDDIKIDLRRTRCEVRDGRIRLSIMPNTEFGVAIAEPLGSGSTQLVTSTLYSGTFFHSNST